ncbi:unnamed protein product, partial [Porites evermanni]
QITPQLNNTLDSGSEYSAEKVQGFSCHFYSTPFLPAAFSFVEKIQKPGACFKEGKQTIMIWTNFITL